MKRIFLLFLIVVLTFTSCEKEPVEPTKLTEENLYNYVSIDITFGDLTVTDLSYGDTKRNVLSCLCTITVIPNADYNFENAYIRYKVNDNENWNVVMTRTANDSSGPLLSSGDVKLYLDKNGYGSDSFYVWQTFSSSPININKHYPAQLRWDYEIKSVAGTVVENTNQ